MAKIKYRAISFPSGIYGKELYGDHEIVIDWWDIVWSAITVGKKNSAQIATHGVFSVFETWIQT